ncbi:MAG: DNRLRE domain-containing protein [bacterium]|nr:DNRLRE domain-containing protein [bacterium]
MNRFFNLVCCGVLIALSHSLHAQLSTASLQATADSYTNTRLPTTPNGSDPTMKSGTEYTIGPRGGSLQYHQRVYVKFNIAGSIPTNAIIYSAELRLTMSGSSTGSFDWKTKMIKSTWTEGGVTANNQPTISNLTSDVVTTTPVASGTQTIDVTDMVQRMSYYPSSNHGWCVQVSNEAAASNTGALFHTREAMNFLLRPVLYIEYYLPVTLSNVVVTHESGVGASDGGVDYNHTSVGSTTHTYQWYNGAGQLMLGETNKQLTNVPYGWYGVEITGVNTGEKAYFGFLVGTECEEVTITYTTSPNFTSNSFIYDRVISGGIDYRDVNYGNTANFRTDNWNNSPWTDIKSYLDFNTWMDDAFTVNQADLQINGWAHWNSGTTNESQFKMVNDYWNENVITWNASPNVSSSAITTIPNTTSSNQNMTVDMIDAWNDWKTNNLANYGIEFGLQYFDDNFNTRQMYYSPNASSNRPSWTFKLSLIDNFSFSYCHPDWPPHIAVQKTLDGSYTQTVGGVLHFQYDEEYKVDLSEFLKFNIYNESRNIVASADGAGGTTGSISPLTYSFDDNRYELDLSVVPGLQSDTFLVLEVFTAKGQKRYLKILYKA